MKQTNDSGSDRTKKTVTIDGSIIEYEILKPDAFRGWAKVGEDHGITRIDDEGLIYTIIDGEFVKMCIMEGIIRVRGGKVMRRITTPDHLIERIKRVERSISGGESEYLITTDDGSVTLLGDEYEVIGGWRKKFREIGYIITFPGSSQKGVDLNDMYMWIGEVEHIVHESLRTEDELMSDVFMARLADLPVVMAAEDYVGQKNVLSEGKTYVVSTSTMHDLMRELGWQHIGLHRLGRMLKEWKARDNSQKRRVGRRVSEWYFTRWEM